MSARACDGSKSAAVGRTERETETAGIVAPDQTMSEPAATRGGNSIYTFLECSLIIDDSRYKSRKSRCNAHSAAANAIVGVCYFRAGDAVHCIRQRHGMPPLGRYSPTSD